MAGFPALDPSALRLWLSPDLPLSSQATCIIAYFSSINVNINLCGVQENLVYITFFR
jgi:hypothetical protein